MSNEPEVYLPDSRLEPVADTILARYPLLMEHNAEFVTVRHEPPFTGQLPEGKVGTSNIPVVQFLIVSQHPRPIQQKMGIKHTTVGTVYEVGWEQAEQEYKNGHYVNGGTTDPLLTIYMGLAFKHSEDLRSLKEMN